MFSSFQLNKVLILISFVLFPYFTKAQLLTVPKDEKAEEVKETPPDSLGRRTPNGTVKGFGGIDVTAFEITGKLNRQAYGLTWNTLTEAGGVVVSDEVKLEIFAEFTKA